MKKIIIIGSSIAGASAACLLAPYVDIVVYEQKARKNVGKKVCANVVTSTFSKYARYFNINAGKLIVSKFNKAVGFSKNSRIVFKTDEFEIDREKFVEQLIKNAEKKGAKFFFDAEFVDFKENQDKFVIKLRKNRKNLTDDCDILVGADGALSNVAKKAGLWGSRRLFLVMHTRVPFRNIKNFKIKKGAYYIFFGRKNGYYGYVFPSKNKAVIGAGDAMEKAIAKYKRFLKFLGIKCKKIEAALVPEPKIIPQTKNLFLIGDAGCYIKFSGGGIVPAMISAIALKEAITENNFKRFKDLKRRNFINRIAMRILERMDDKEFDELMEILKDKKFSELVLKRDEFSRKEYIAALDFRILKFLLRLI